MAEYTLMNKNHPVVSFRYDRDIHAVVKVLDVHDLKYAPIALADQKGVVSRRALNGWWQRRAIPASRNQIQQLLDSLDIDSTLGQESSGNPNLISPNSTLGGDLNKKWKIVDGKRILVKGGTGSTQQEVLNEIVATALYSRLLDKGDFVPYFLFEENGRIYSACENMLGPDEELVTAYDVISAGKKSNSMSDFDFLVESYKGLGLENVEESLSKMFTCDYILANQDRHWRNFGVIRNVETLEFTRFAPIFDNGTSLWCHAYNILAEDSYIAKPFGPKGMAPDKQLSLFRDYSWFDRGKLVGFPLEAKEILSHGNDGIQARLDVIESRIERNIGGVQRHIEKLAVGQKEPLRVKRDKVLQTPRMNDSVSRTERER